MLGLQPVSSETHLGSVCVDEVHQAELTDATSLLQDSPVDYPLYHRPCADLDQRTLSYMSDHHQIKGIRQRVSPQSFVLLVSLII